MSARLEEMLRIARAATPGPWSVQKGNFGVGRYVQGSDGHPVCQMSANSTPKGMAKERSGEALANAQHIATFNPRTAEALVKVAMAAQAVAYIDGAILARLPVQDAKRLVVEAKPLQNALSALTAALEDQTDGQ